MDIANRYAAGGFRLPYKKSEVLAYISEEFGIPYSDIEFLSPRVYTFNVGSLTIWRMWDTDIVTYDHEANTILLNNGGYQTMTTKMYMNKILSELDHGAHVYQKNWEWFLCHGDSVSPFVNPMHYSLRGH